MSWGGHQHSPLDCPSLNGDFFFDLIFGLDSIPMLTLQPVDTLRELRVNDSSTALLSYPIPCARRTSSQHYPRCLPSAFEHRLLSVTRHSGQHSVANSPNGVDCVSLAYQVFGIEERAHRLSRILTSSPQTRFGQHNEG